MAHQTDAAPMRENPITYGLVSRANHWIIAVGMMALLFSGMMLAYGPLTREAAAPIRDWHKAIGVLVLVYGLWRVGWRLVQGFPKPAAVMPQWQETVAKLAHWALLVTVLAMPVSGILMSIYNGRPVNSFGLVIPAQDKVEWIAGTAYMVHHYVGWALLALLALHVAAAFKHHLIDRDSTLRRMIGRYPGADQGR